MKDLLFIEAEDLLKEKVGNWSCELEGMSGCLVWDNPESEIIMYGTPNWEDVGMGATPFEYTDEENDLTYILADSGWLDFGSKEDEVAEDIISRTDEAIDYSDLLVWIVEFDRVTELDEKIFKLLEPNRLFSRCFQDDLKKYRLKVTGLVCVVWVLFETN